MRANSLKGMSDNNAQEWFATWFDSPFYHELYVHRDELEADSFIRRIVAHLNIESGDRVLDLACGKGRHARVFHSLGCDVTGVDLSSASIQAARSDSHPDIRFEVADMRSFELNTTYDAVFNLFTSFGYFAEVDDNRKMLYQVYRHLNQGGYFVLDFLNSEKVRKDLVSDETIARDRHTFFIHRETTPTHVIKTIRFEDNGEAHRYQERVQLFNRTELETLCREAGLVVEQVFGDYSLQPFSADHSPRCILLARKQ